MEKIIKARKNHVCHQCDKPIFKGENYLFISTRYGTYESSGEQDGIEYLNVKAHLPEKHCDWPEDCKRGDHTIIYFSDKAGYCEECGTDIENIKPRG